MNFDNLPGQIFFKNKFMESNLARTHILSHSLHFASSVFEGIRVYNYIPFYLKSHLLRLEASCDLMMIESPFNIEEIYELCIELIKKNNLKNGYLRPIIFKGTGSMAPESLNCSTNLAIAGWEWQSLFDEKKSIKLLLSKWKKPHESVFPVKAKSSGSYQIATLAKNEALLKGYDDALLLDTNNFIAEGTACNIFWRKKNTIFTPKTHSILNGITRKIVISILEKKNISLQVGDFKIGELYDADEVFFTGTAAEIMNISSIESCNYASTDIAKFIKKEFDNLKKIGGIEL
tara:strand:+ start:263 stop:1132 length:870 start_codon:yes stop_codon:yes gene_type:complete